MSHVRDILRTKGDRVLTIAPNLPVTRVAERMREANVGAFVVSRDGRQLEGLITERDIVFGLARKGVGLLDMPAEFVMERAPMTCSPDDTVRAAMRKMTDARVRHLPVRERGELCGMISLGDVVKFSVTDAELETKVIRDAYLASRSR
jgi:CBS domain-containing protein